MSCSHQIKECKCCGTSQFCVWYRRNWWCEICWVICLLQLALDSDDEESPWSEKSSDILGSENEDKTRKRKRHTSLDSDDEDSQRTQEPSDTLGDKVTATKQKLRAFVSDSLGDEYERIWGCKQCWMCHRRKFDVIDLVRFSMEALEQQHKRLAYNWRHRSERDKFQALIESCYKDTFSARYSIDALVQYHSELARLWTYRSEIDKSKDPIDKDVDQNNKLASKSTIVLEDTCVLGSSTSAKGSAETWAGTFARTCGSIFRIFSKDEKQMSLDLVKPLQDQAVAWVPPPPPDPPNPS